MHRLQEGPLPNQLSLLQLGTLRPANTQPGGRFGPAPASLGMWHLAMAFALLTVLGGCGDGGSGSDRGAPDTSHQPGPTTSNHAASNHPASNHAASSHTPASTSGQASTSSSASELPGRVKLKHDDGTTAYDLKPREDGAKLFDGQDHELARYTRDQGKYKVKDADDQVLGYIVPGDAQWKIKDATQQVELFKLQIQGDGDMKLEDGDQGLVYRIKRRDYGFEIESPDDQSLYKIKLKGDKLSLRNAQDETVLATRSPWKAASLACLGLDAVSDFRIRVALALALAEASDLP